jgi:hypothetical protein
VDDARINRMLGENVLHPIPLPHRSTEAGSWLPDPWDGAHRFMCEVWENAFRRIRDVRARAGTATLDGEELAALRDAWARALQRNDLDPSDLANASDARTRWRSPSNLLLMEVADVTSVNDGRMYLDPQGAFRELIEESMAKRQHARRRLGELLTDLNLRAYVNQRLADFFQLPYAPAAARVPFRKHLYDRAVSVQQSLYAVAILEDRYAEVAEGVTLRLPLFLAVALLDARTPSDLWPNLAKQRERATPFPDEARGTRRRVRSARPQGTGPYQQGAAHRCGQPAGGARWWCCRRNHCGCGGGRQGRYGIDLPRGRSSAGSNAEACVVLAHYAPHVAAAASSSVVLEQPRR